MFKKTVGVHEQLAFMQLRWPSFTSRIRDGLLMCRGKLSPDPACDIYEISVTYRGGSSPDVRVLEPKLVRRVVDEPIPHMYEQERLCLFLPGVREWCPEKHIAMTILPWTSVWLFFYEVWLATGDWMGGGAEPISLQPIRRELKNGFNSNNS